MIKHSFYDDYITEKIYTDDSKCPHFEECSGSMEPINKLKFYRTRIGSKYDEEQIKILVNIEAQKSTNPSKLGYHLDNRIIYYLGRMISAQKEVEFTKSSYDDLKAVRSIWICMDSADQEDSINRIKFTEETVYGAPIEMKNLNKVQGIIIRLRKNENVEKSKNILIAMLEELLKKEAVA